MRFRVTTPTLKLLAGIAIFTIQTFSATMSVAQNADKIHLGIIYPISTHGTHAPLDTNDFSFHAIAGVSAEERGLAFAGFSNIVRNNVKGLAFAGFSNHIGKRAEGLLFAGFLNTSHLCKGMQFSGFANVTSSSVEGAQYAGFVNTAGDVKGAQLAGFANIAKSINGAQLAGFINTANNTKGSQLAGFANISASDVGGHQLAGFINAGRNVSGSQIAGFINIARAVKGVQIAGFINIADSSDCPIGIINIIKNGEKSIGLSIDETGTTLLSFRSGGKILYGIIGVGYNWKNEEEVYAFETGLGAHLLKSKTFRLNTEIAATSIESFKWGEYFKTSLRLMPSFTLAKHLEVFGGPSMNYLNTNTSEGKTLVDHYFYKHQNRWNDNFQALYLGYIAGVNFKF